MRYQNIVPGTFLARPNRFIARVLVEGREETVHVKNTGRCKELLVPGCRVWLEKSDNPARKTLYDLVTVEKKCDVSRETSVLFSGDGLRASEEKSNVSRETFVRVINMDSQAPNKLFAQWAGEGHFVPGLTLLRPETTWGSSRFDFYWEAAPDRKGFVEIKGCTLEREGWTYFPDAPTERGVKHLRELIRARAEGYEAAVCFVIQMAGVEGFSPNDETHPAFGEALREARAAGVELLAYECSVVPGEVRMTRPVPIKL